MKRMKLGLLLVVMLLGMGNHTVYAEVIEEQDLDYIYGRPMTEEEREEQRMLVPELYMVEMEDEVEEPALAMRERNVLPTSYDARVEGYVSEVKNQNPYGICWAFTANALAETSCLMQGIELEADFSELHTAYYFYHRTTDPLGLTVGDQNNPIATNDYRSNGGNNIMAALAMSGWLGTESEEDAPYEWMKYQNPPLKTEQEFSSDFKLENAYFIKGGTEAIKQAILDYGAVGIMYYHDYDYYHPDTAAYCYAGSKTGVTNHAVTIVGWDDTYAKENFLACSGVEVDGAWIVKNSWGDTFGDAGYFYLSYEDSLIMNAYAAEWVDGDTYQHNYHYDGSSLATAIKITGNRALANVYTACANEESGEVLQAVNVALYSTDVKYQVQIYRDLKDESDPCSGTAVLSKPLEGVTTYAGIYTISLPEQIYLESGCKFSIVVSLPEGASYYVEANRSAGKGTPWISSTAVLAEGQSFVRSSSGKWTDLSQLSAGSSGESMAHCARIKGFTSDAQEKPQDFSLTKCKKNQEQEVILSWNAVEEADGYYIYRSTSIDGTYEWCGSVEGSKTIVWKGELEKDGLYFYRVAPWCMSERGIEIRKCTDAKLAADEMVLTGSSAGYQSVVLSWNAANGASGYRIYRSTKKESGYQAIRNLKDASILTYTNSKLITGTQYYYKMRAFYEMGGTTYYSDYTEPIAVLPKLSTPQVKGGSYGYQAIKLSWQKIGGASGYRIYRSTKKESGYQAIRNLTKGSILSYINQNLTTGNVYYYKMRAFCKVNGKTYYSDYSTPVAVKPVPKKAVLRSLNVQSGKKINVQWDKVTGATGYCVYRSDSKDSGYTLLKTVSGTSARSFIDGTSKKTGKTYYYKVKAYRTVNGKKVFGAASDTKKIIVR